MAREHRTNRRFDLGGYSHFSGSSMGGCYETRGTFVPLPVSAATNKFVFWVGPPKGVQKEHFEKSMVDEGIRRPAVSEP